MLKFRGLCLGMAACLSAGTAQAALLGPDAAQCAAGTGPAVLVHVVGLKNRAGTIRARSFGGNPSTWFSKKTWLKRTEFQTPATGTIDICMPVPRAGIYAVDIRHDINANSDTDMADGGGSSGNPDVSLFDVIFGRKPPAEKTSIKVGEGITAVTVIVKYKDGGSFKALPIVETVRR
jgi:uncharacterized protein (DUF2141 family)